MDQAAWSTGLFLWTDTPIFNPMPPSSSLVARHRQSPPPAAVAPHRQLLPHRWSLLETMPPAAPPTYATPLSPKNVGRRPNFPLLPSMLTAATTVARGRRRSSSVPAAVAAHCRDPLLATAATQSSMSAAPPPKVPSNRWHLPLVCPHETLLYGYTTTKHRPISSPPKLPSRPPPHLHRPRTKLTRCRDLPPMPASSSNPARCRHGRHLPSSRWPLAFLPQRRLPYSPPPANLLSSKAAEPPPPHRQHHEHRHFHISSRPSPSSSVPSLISMAAVSCPSSSHGHRSLLSVPFVHHGHYPSFL